MTCWMFCDHNVCNHLTGLHTATKGMYAVCLSTVPLTPCTWELTQIPSLPIPQGRDLFSTLSPLTSLHCRGLYGACPPLWLFTWYRGHMVAQVGRDTSQTRSRAVHTQPSYFPWGGQVGTEQVCYFLKRQHKVLNQWQLRCNSAQKKAN